MIALLVAIAFSGTPMPVAQATYGTGDVGNIRSYALGTTAGWPGHYRGSFTGDLSVTNGSPESLRFVDASDQIIAIRDAQGRFFCGRCRTAGLKSTVKKDLVPVGITLEYRDYSPRWDEDGNPIPISHPEPKPSKDRYSCSRGHTWEMD